jgi:hypothetical protein
MTIMNCAMGFSSNKGLVPAWKMAESFSFDDKLASAIDIAELRIASQPGTPIWSNWWTTASSEFYGLSPAGRPVVAVLHGTGPLASLRGTEGVMGAYSWEFNDKSGSSRGGRISRATFHGILDGKHGPVYVSDFSEETSSPYFLGDGRSCVDVDQALKSNWLVARLGGYDRAERYLQAIIERGADEFFRKRPGPWFGRDEFVATRRKIPIVACVQSDHAPCWEYTFHDDVFLPAYEPNLRDISSPYATAGLLVMEPVRFARGERSDDTRLETGVSIQDWTDSAKFMGLRDGGGEITVHYFSHEDAIEEEQYLTTVDFPGADGFHSLIQTGSGELAVQYPKRGNTTDTGLAMCGLLEVVEIGTAVFAPEIRPHHSFDYALKEIVRIAPRGANAYLLGKIAEGGRTAEVTFYKVVADLTRRKMKPEEIERHTSLVVELAERQVRRERGEVEKRRNVMADNVTSDLAADFWALPLGARRAVCENLELLDADETRLPEGQRYSLAFVRAGERGLSHLMHEEIHRHAT